VLRHKPSFAGAHSIAALGGSRRAFARRGIVPARKIGNHRRFLEADLRQVGASDLVSI